MTLAEWIFWIVVIVGVVPVLVIMVWVYWWLFRFAQREEMKDLQAEQRLVEDLGADTAAPIPPARQVPVWILVAGFLLGAWPFFLLGNASLG